MSILEVDRERVIQTLCAHYANDHLTTQELEARFDLAYKASSANDLNALLASLPVLPLTVAMPGSPAPAPWGKRATSSDVPAERRTMALMSEVQKTGEWIPARRNVIRAIMGTVKLDLREAMLPAGTVDFDVIALMGEIQIIVPPGLRIECDGHAIMGEFKELHSSGGDDPSASLVRVRGAAIMGSVVVRTRLPGESALQAWRRRLKNRV